MVVGVVHDAPLSTVVRLDGIWTKWSRVRVNPKNTLGLYGAHSSGITNKKNCEVTI